MQSALILQGYNAGSLSAIDEKTLAAALSTYQNDHRLARTGRIDFETAQALGVLPASLTGSLAAERELAARVQLALVLEGFDPGPIDGDMGLQTTNALKRFQAANGIPADGLVDLETLRALRATAE